MQQEPIKWKVDFDAVTHERHARSYYRHQWRSELLEYTWFCMGAATCGLIVAGAVLYADKNFGQGEALMGGVVISAVMAAMYQMYVNQRNRDKTVEKAKGSRWTFELLDEGLRWENGEGVYSTIPWSQMSIFHESKDGLTITDGQAKWFLMRKPMQEAGVEDEVVSRLSRK